MTINMWIVSAGSILISANSREILKLYNSPVGNITSIFARSDSSVVIGGQDGIGILKNENWTIINSQNSDLSSNPIKQIFCNGDTIYVDHENNFSIIRGSQIVTILKDNQAFPNVAITEIGINSGNKIVLGTENSGIIVYGDGNWNVYDSVKSISDIFIDEDDNIWFTYPAIGGIGKISNDEYTFYYPPETIAGDPYMLSLMEDTKGIIWCGSTSSEWDGALFKFDRNRNEWSSIQADNNDASDSFVIYRLESDSRNNIWFYRGYRSLCVYNEDGIK